MIRSVTRWCVLGLTVCWMNDAAALAQSLPRHLVTPISSRTTVEYGELHGVVRDSAGQPLSGAVVSAHGDTFTFQVSDRRGQFSFRDLHPGPYLVRVHLDGYVPPRGRYIQVNAGRRHSWSVALPRVSTAGAPAILEAGVGGAGPSRALGDDEEASGDDSELAWWLRQIPRGVLKDAQARIIERGDHEVESFLGRAAGSPGRLAAALFADVTLNGQINLLTITSFDRPEDLFATGTRPRQPVAYMSLVAPANDGEWAFRGAITQGEISSWILAGSYGRVTPASHRYEAGFSYSTQQYQGGNVEALAAIGDGSRHVGELYVSDIWTIDPQWTVAAGGRYASYGYLQDRDLLSGRLTLEFQPAPDDPLRLRVSAAHREIAPGAEEFVPPATGPWLPPERTFSELSRGTLTPERVDHLEVAGEREVHGVLVSMRAFRQQVGDQLVTLFGVAGAPTDLGHYYVTTGGDFDNYGWGVGVSRPMGIVQASVDYTQVDTRRRGIVEHEPLFLAVAPALLRDTERVHDLTATMNMRVPQTATRFLMVYKLNNAFATEAEAATAARFEVQVNQEMPFLNFTGARWEMLAAVRNLFRSDLFDGSIYDELLVVRPPKRVVGGVTVRF